MSTATLNIEKKKALIPQLRFPDFEGIDSNSSYRKHAFKDIFQFSTGKNIKQSEASPEFETPCVRYGELYHMYNEVIYKIINKTNLEKSELLFSKGDEILLPSAGEDPLDIGSASALTIENVAIGRTINILRPINENIYSQIYVSYYINEKLRKKISKLAKGSSISNVYNSDLKTLEIILPNLPEQQKIAFFLNAVNEKIQLLSRKRELLQQYKIGVMQQLFSGKLRFKDENGNNYADWEEKRLGIYLSHKSKRNKDFKVDLVLSVSNKKGFISQNEQFDGYEVASKDLSNYKIVDKNDIAYNPSRINVGSIARLVNFEKGIVSPMYVVFSLKKGLDPIFFENLYSTHLFKHLIKVGCSGSVRDSLNFEDLADFNFKFPSIQEQQRIAAFLLNIDVKIESVNQQITQTQTFKKGLLQQMFV